MTELEIGDRVRVIVSNTREGDEATVLYTFCEYGDHGVCVQFDDGEKLERAESSVEYIGPDKYEYATQRSSKASGAPFPETLVWMTKAEAESDLELLGGSSQFYKYTLVKRRKAGKVEDV